MPRPAKVQNSSPSTQANIGFEEVEDDGEPFEDKMSRLVAELQGQFAESIESIHVKDKSVDCANVGDPAGFSCSKVEFKIREGLRVFKLS